VEFTLYLRIPGWSNSSQVTVNGKAQSGATPGQYLAIKRRWAAGDTVELKLNMKPQVLEASRRVVEDFGRVAVQRGPLVYCLEQLDQPTGVALYDVTLDLRKKNSGEFQEEFRSDLLGGIIVLKHAGAVEEGSGSGMKLYSAYTPDAPKSRAVELNFIPYYAWANRTATPMQVWTPVSTA
jgi:hypothetical protein